MSRHLTILVLVICLTGCASPDIGPPELHGSYWISFETDDVRAQYELELSEENGRVSGSGDVALEEPDSTEAFLSDLSISGTHDHPSLELEITIIETGRTHTFRGEVRGENRAKGTLTIRLNEKTEEIETALERP